MLAPTPGVIVNSTDATRRLHILGLKSKNLRVPLTQIKNLIVADHVKNFDSGGSLFGGWPSISPNTASSGAPLVRTGALRKDIGKKSGPGKKVRKYEVRVGVGTTNDSDQFYARFHQAGAPAGKRRGELPKRELVGITDATGEKGVEIIRRYIVSE